MGLTAKSSGLNLLRQNFNIEQDKKSSVIALAGNPNTGKSTVFNGLTGLNQHTGNWPGKTVAQAQGYFKHKDQEFTLVDLPGTYSLLANSSEEKVARDFICFARPDTTIVVADATNLERNLNLVLQVTELTDNVILCLNLMDEAERKKIEIDIAGLERDLKIPVIPTVARDMKGLEELKETAYSIVNKKINVHPYKITYSLEIESAVEEIVDDLKNLTGLKKYLNLHWLGLRLLEGDKTIIESMTDLFPENKYNGVETEGVVQTDGVS